MEKIHIITVYYSLLNIKYYLKNISSSNCKSVFTWMGWTKYFFFRSFSDLGKFNRDVKNHSDMFYFFRYADRYSNKNGSVPSVKSLRNTVENQHEVNILTIFKCFNRYMNEI